VTVGGLQVAGAVVDVAEALDAWFATQPVICCLSITGDRQPDVPSSSSMA
jgi:hypothetical protein